MSNQIKNILIRADSSFTIGTGHIMRDLVLAKQYLNDNIIFATQNLKGNINHKIFEANYKIEILNSNDFNELNDLIKKFNIDMLIIDHYEIDFNFERKIKESNSNLKIMVLDDTYEKHYCDILLNHNINADEKRYRNLVPKDCKLKCGAEYTLLRDEFLIEKNTKYKKDIKNKTIFIAMGGADTSFLNIKILEILKEYKNLKVNLITTTANKNLEKLIKYTKNKKWVNLYINSNQVAKLAKQSSFAIVTPSVIVNEIFHLGIPFISIKTANNQNEIYEYLKKLKFPMLEKFNAFKLRLELRKLCC